MKPVGHANTKISTGYYAKGLNRSRLYYVGYKGVCTIIVVLVLQHISLMLV